MARNIIYILIIFYYFEFIYCVDYQYDRPNSKPQDVSVQFPKYNIKIAPAIVKRPLPIVYEDAEIPNSSEEQQNQPSDYNNDNHEPNIYYVESEPIRVLDYNAKHITHNNYNNEHLQPYKEFNIDYNNEQIQPLSYYQKLLNNYKNGHLKPVIHHEIHNDYNNEHEIQNNQPYYHNFNEQLYVQEQPKHQPTYGHEIQNNQPYYHDFNEQLYVQEQPKYQPTYGHASFHITPQSPVHFNHYEHPNQPNNHLYNTNIQQSALPHRPYQPIITREPVTFQHKINPEYLRNSDDFDENLGIPRKHKDSYFYTAPNWDQNAANNMNILRAPNPRGVIASHTSFIKFKKPDLGSKVFFTNHKKYIDTNHGFGGSNIYKNTHIHVHNREANENNNNNDIIGSHLFAGPRWRRDTPNIDHSRTKRGVLDIARLVVDPKSKLDVEKTSENVGAITRNAFEEDYSPMFHLTNALGSAQDSFISFMNVRPSGILVPCSYRTVSANEAVSSPMLEAINPAIYNRHPSYSTENPSPIVSPIPDNSNPSVPVDSNPSIPNESQSQYMSHDVGDPLHQIGNKLRESVQWAQKSAQHAVDAMHHTRNIFVSATRNWPKIILPYAGAVEVNRPAPGEEIVGTSRDPEYVGVGRMMDSLGMTDRKPDLNLVGGPRMISEEEMILQKAKEVLGAPTYRHFMDDMKKHLDISGNSEQVGRPRYTPNTDLQTKLALSRLRSALAIQKAKAKSDLIKLKIPKIPPYRPLPRLANPLIPKPSLNFPKPIIPAKPASLLPIKPLNPILKSSNPSLDKIKSIIENLKPTTTTIKPEMPLEKLRAKLFQKYNINPGENDLLGKTLNAVKNKDQETVGAAQNGGVPVPVLTKEMRTPFMGLATKQDLENYFKKLYCSNCKMGSIK